MICRRVLVVDDAAAVREGVASILGFHSQDWVICGECSNGQEALAHHESLKPDVILLDLSLPDQNGLVVARQILAQNPAARIVIMSEHDPTTLSFLTRGVTRLSVPKSRLAQSLIPTLRQAVDD